MQQVVRRRVFSRRAALALASATAAAVTIPLALPAHAGGAPVSISNWYYDDPGMSASAAAQQSTPSGVNAGDLGVGYQVGGTSPVAAPVTVPKSEPDKITGLVFTLGAVGLGSTVSSFTFSLPVDMTDAASMAQVAGNAPALAACLSERAIQPDTTTGPSPYEKMPSYSCSTKATGKYNAATGAYDFTATNIAQAWASDANNGLVVLPDPATANPTTFTLSLLPAAKITASITGTPAPASAAPVAPSTVATDDAAPVTGSSAPATTTVPRQSTPVTRPVTVTPANPVAAAPAPVGVAAAPVDAAPAAQAPTAQVGAAQVPAATDPIVAAPAAAPVAPAGDAGVSAPAAAGVPAAVTPVRQAAATKPVSVSSGIGPVGYVALVLVLVAVLAATSLGLAKPAEATGSQVSRLTKMLNS